MSITAKLARPLVPDYVSIEIKNVVAGSAPKIRICDLTEKQRDELAKMYRENLDKVAERQLANPAPVYRGG